MAVPTPTIIKDAALAVAVPILDAGGSLRSASQAAGVPYTTLDSWLRRQGRVTPRPWRHRLTEIDVTQALAECEACGLTPVRMNLGRGHWICKQGERARRILRLYGVSEEDFRALWEAQQGLCAGCSTWMDEPCVDHNHTTGLVRGLLCHTCNRAAGLLGDNPQMLRALATYLERSV